MARPRAEEPRVHRHWTNLTDAEEAAWGEAVRRLHGGSPLQPRDSDAVRLALRKMTEAQGVPWPGAEKGQVLADTARKAGPTPPGMLAAAELPATPAKGKRRGGA